MLFLQKSKGCDRGWRPVSRGRKCPPYAALRRKSVDKCPNSGGTTDRMIRPELQGSLGCFCFWRENGKETEGSFGTGS